MRIPEQLDLARYADMTSAFELQGFIEEMIVAQTLGATEFSFRARLRACHSTTFQRSAFYIERTVVTFNWTRTIREFVYTPAE
jgi:hypothetical protein